VEVQPMLSGALSPTHWLIIIAVFAVLFGAKRLPEAARGVGEAVRIFKAETADQSSSDPRQRAVTPPEEVSGTQDSDPPRGIPAPPVAPPQDPPVG
jgi:sec-independent protein translocase protein TatA